MEVARLLHDESGADEELLAATFLHDVVEDTDATLAEIGERFGDGVGALCAADKLANLRDMRSLDAALGDAAAGRFNAPIEVQGAPVAARRGDAGRGRSAVSLLAAFRSELDAFDAERAATA